MDWMRVKRRNHWTIRSILLLKYKQRIKVRNLVNTIHRQQIQMTKKVKRLVVKMQKTCFQVSQTKSLLKMSRDAERLWNRYSLELTIKQKTTLNVYRHSKWESLLRSTIFQTRNIVKSSYNCQKIIHTWNTFLKIQKTCGIY